MPPNTVSGIVIALQMSMMITMVPNGSAAVDCHAQAGVIGVSCMVRWRLQHASLTIRQVAHGGVLWIVPSQTGAECYKHCTSCR